MLVSLAWASTLLITSLPAAQGSANPRTPLENYRQNLAHGGKAIPGEFLLTVGHEDDFPQLRLQVSKLGCQWQRRLGKSKFALISCPAETNMEAMFGRFEGLQTIDWAEASYIEEEEASANDMHPLQWALNNRGQEIDSIAGLMGADLSAGKAWEVTTGSREIVILVSDSGLHWNHVDLANQIWTNEDEDCSNGQDDDNNGYVDDCRGFDFANDDNDPTPTTLPEMKDSGSACLKWHASMIAGLAGAEGNNRQGISGINWQVSLMNIKKHRDSSCVSTTSRSIESIVYGTENGANIISMSFSSSNYNASFEQALINAEAAGVLVISSGGNGGRNNDDLRRYPNQYNVQHQLTVVNSNNRDELYEGSNYGANYTLLAAPGTYVLSTGVDSTTDISVGTGSSYSAGVAAGAAALVWSAFPELNAGQISQSIKEGVRKLDSMDCTRTRRCVKLGGRIDLFGALKRAGELSPAGLKSERAELEGSNFTGVQKVQLKLTLKNDGAGAFFKSTTALSAPDGTLAFSNANGGLDKIAAGSESVLISEVTLPMDCQGTQSTPVTLQLQDALERSVELNFDVNFECQQLAKPDAGMMSSDAGTNPADSGSDVVDEEKGCACHHSMGVARPGMGWVWALALLLGLGLISKKRTI